jgi:hypothetical protein
VSADVFERIRIGDAHTCTWQSVRGTGEAVSGDPTRAGIQRPVGRPKVPPTAVLGSTFDCGAPGNSRTKEPIGQEVPLLQRPSGEKILRAEHALKRSSERRKLACARIMSDSLAV